MKAKTVQKALQELLQVRPPDGSVTVHLATKMGDRVDYYFLPLMKPAASKAANEGPQSASRRFSEVLEGGLQKVKDLQKQDAAPPWPHSGTVIPLQGQLEYIDLAATEHRQIQVYLEPLLSGALAPNFDSGDESIISHLRFYTIHDPGRELRAFRILSPKIELSRSRRFAIVGTAHGGAYDLAEDRIFLFDDAVDCLLWQDRWLFILHRTQFQQMFGYFEMLEATKEQVLTDLGSRNVIDGFDRLTKDASGIAMTTKLAGMKEAPVLADGGPPSGYWERIRFVIEAFGLKVRVVGDGDGDGQRFLYDPDHKWQLMHLLSDDYHVSPQAPQPTRRGSRSLHKTWEELRFDVIVQQAPAALRAAPAVATSMTAQPRKGPRKAPDRSTETETAKQPA